MSTRALRPGYHGDLKDSVDKFHGQQLINIAWDRHLMYATPLCIPVPPGMPFGALVEQVLPGLFGQHPDFARIDWSGVQWLRSDEPFEPRPELSLVDNGLDHKAFLRLRTPGLDGLAGASF
ncbi:phenol 2-monooxygenase P4 subunit [Sphaerotilus hippei]|uniref:Phenol 2-monooxygenase P4 subunit n=1 Tax=Sphaerotilus hippei TaxID=744406 RepID=A0A318GUC7_9BURK|nr:phenol hydroxylase subunit P4 [Sphaerotilus hippei]PXW92298.1 phenol 2-monooxygenase P4 subunit [Sphaerotilus hippei]